MDQLEIRTEDGTCPAYRFRPAGTGPWPALLFYMDGLGIRPALFEMGERMAAHGYLVLLPDLFYRSGPYAPMDPAAIFGDPAARQHLMQNFIGKLGQANAMRDTRTFLTWFDAQDDDVAPGMVGTTGYCLGGGLSLAAAAQFPDRVAAAAAYHPGGLATDAADSVHRQAGSMRGELYIGRASDDAGFDDAMRDRLEAALREAGVRYTLETYPAKHGWVPSDTPIHDPVEAEHHWRTLFALMDRALGRS